jgi:hypothetical protein
MRGTYEFKYNGILKKCNIDPINRENFQILIDAGIFEFHDLRPQDLTIERYNGIELDDASWGFSDYFEFNKKGYNLKKEIYDHMFDRCESKCENEDVLNYKINEIDFNLNFQITYESKIKYLKHQIFSLSSLITEPQNYLLYAKESNKLEYKNWFEFFYEEQVENCEFDYVFKYLKGDKDFVPDFIFEIWQEYFLVKHVTGYCIGKIGTLQFKSGLNEADIEINFPTISAKSEIEKKLITTLPETKNPIDRLFLEGEYDFFQYIVHSYKDKQNKAFFSYIYHYFSDNKLLIKNNKSSLLYNSFLVKNNYLSEFSKVIQRSQFDSGDEEKRLFTIFDNFRDSFIQKKMKEI